MFRKLAEKSSKHTKHCFWQNEYHPIEFADHQMKQQKPVIEGLVDELAYYPYRSARDYAGIKGLLPIKFLN